MHYTIFINVKYICFLLSNGTMFDAYSFSVNNDTIDIELRLQIIAKNDPARC